MKGAIFRPTSSTLSVRSFCLCTYHWKLSSSWVSIESSGLENIARIPANRAKDAQNTMRVRRCRLLFHSENEVGPYFGSTSLTPSVRSFCLCTYHWKLSSSWVSIESSGLENIPRSPANRAKDAQNQDASKAVSATLSLWKWSGAIFRFSKLDTEVALLLPVVLFTKN